MFVPSLEITKRIESELPGYARLEVAQFRRLTFPQRMVFQDHHLREELTMQDMPVLSAGFCDWIDDTTPQRICIGWAWYRHVGDGNGRLAPGGFSRNVQFVRTDGRTVGPRDTDRLLRAWLSMHPWQDSIDGCREPAYRLQVDRLN